MEAPCSHKSANRCLLSGQQCCLCMDKRAGDLNSRYQCYVDGKGMRDCGLRWQSYCASCKMHWTAVIGVEQSHRFADSRHDGSEDPSSHARRRERVRQNMARAFGTREEIDNSEYVSPITSMFQRMYIKREPPIALHHQLSLIPVAKEVECRVCFDNEADTLFLPCAHLMMCSICAPKSLNTNGSTCPVCRNRVDSSLKVHRC